MRIDHRFFYALLPGPREKTAMGLHRDGLSGVKYAVANSRLHLTLAITRDYDVYPDALEKDLRAIGGRIAGDPVILTLNRIVASGTSIALRPSRSARAIRELQAALQNALARTQLDKPGWSFNPHVTLAYRDGPPFSHRISPIGWESRDFALVHSVVGRREHNCLDRWPLVALQGALF